MVMAKCQECTQLGLLKEEHAEESAPLKITSECMVTAVSEFSELVSTLIKAMHNYHHHLLTILLN